MSLTNERIILTTELREVRELTEPYSELEKSFNLDTIN